ncbi:hypothetical protein JCM15765_22740 [Paradesulfitobacterium aromaticivorans]
MAAACRNTFAKGYCNIGNYILESSATVRQTADVFGVSKSTVHTVFRIGVGYIGRFLSTLRQSICSGTALSIETPLR